MTFAVGLHSAYWILSDAFALSGFVTLVTVLENKIIITSLRVYSQNYYPTWNLLHVGGMDNDCPSTLNGA